MNPLILNHMRSLHYAVLRNRHVISPKIVLVANRQHTINTKLANKSSWTHPIYTRKEILAVRTAHHKAHTWQDKVALGSVRFLRWGMDLVTGYKPQSFVGSSVQGYAMSEEKWITRFIFLESVAGVPGMAAGMLRHLKSLRQMKRDHGWIETLLEEAYNERMHLLTFLKLAEPGPLMRLMVLGAQCVFFSGFSVAYMISPQICHRFVGYLEEEAVITYSKAITDLDNGHLPRWENLQAPQMAIKYWQMPEGQRCIRSLLLYVRADEAKHREVNHTLGNLNQTDPNPFSAKFKVQDALSQLQVGGTKKEA
ncbi:Alternative oxidase, mitochondrial [Penicillium brasilianum]|uniref:Alternative oxidase n=1 Tax=Penicillium brasilianum TaxID=104259 RepID=A0A1S9RW17_PENBI|nr:Alternative oxidase, mitochondrial [Penicillium brasilianum]